MPDPSDSAVRELAGAILSRREYARASDTSEPAFVDWVRRFFEWIAKLDELHRTAPVLYWTIFAAAVALSILLVAHIVWMLRVALRAPAAPAEPDRAPPRPDFAGQAEELATAGRHLEAAHCLMIASFRTLAERAVIELRPDRSNRWIRSALRGSKLGEGLAADIDALVERTERSWFGNRENDPEVYVRWRSAFERLSSAER